MTSLSCSSWDSCPLQLAGRQVKHNVYDDHTFTIPVEQMLYAFTGTAAIRGLIDAPYVRAPSFHRSHLYVRTVKGVFFVYFRSLAELLEHLGAMHFLLLHYGLCVNPHLEMEFDLRRFPGKNVPGSGHENWTYHLG